VALLDAGVNIVRVNASHGTPEIRERWIRLLHNVRDQRQSPTAQYVQGSFTITPLAGLRLTYSVRYDALTEEFREHYVLLHYEGVCFKIDTSFRVRKAGQTAFLFQINLLSL